VKAIRACRSYPRCRWLTVARLGCVLLATLPVWPALGQSLQGVVQVSLVVDRGCLVSSAGSPIRMLRPSRLDFGHYPRLDPPGGALSAQLLDLGDAAPVVRLACNPDVEQQLQVDSGQNAGHGDVRYLRLRNGDATIAYRLFVDAARQHPLDTTPLSRRAGPGPVELTLYASVIPQESAPVAGRYQDTLHLTLTW
jgi:spore coat protein U-like protein